MKAISILCCFLMCSLAVIAQSVPVVELSSADAARVKRVHQEMLDAEQAWNALQADISDRYLIVDKNDPAASDVKWHPRGITTTIRFMTGTSNILAWSSDPTPTCKTAEEKKQERAREKQEQAEEEKARDELEAKSRRVRKGWEQKNCGNCEPLPFDYSDDYRFLVKRPPAPAPAGSIQFGPTYPIGGTWLNPLGSGPGDEMGVR